MKYESVRGMKDLLPAEASIWQHIERIARAVLESCGFKEIRTPILEETGVFTRSIGETSDIVKKEMYTFLDRGGRSLTMRPEGTAPIVRAYIEHGLDKIYSDTEARLYYLGPMFRAERPQKGRLRQFHQIGAEIIGSSDSQFDFELIIQIEKMLSMFGLKDFIFKVNNLGCAADKDAFSKRLRDYLKPEKARLCDDCKVRIEKNVLRVLDCKNESCKAVVRNAPGMHENLCDKCRLNFNIFTSSLKADGVSFEIATNLVRGLDYYTGNVFEIVHPKLGGQDAIGAGGRYDNLVKDMGGPDVGAVGYAIGIERVILALGEDIELLKPEVVFFATLGENTRPETRRLAEEVRKRYNTFYQTKVVVLIGGMGGASLKSQMRSADKNGARIVVIIGEDEIKKGAASVRDMKDKNQSSLAFDKVEEEIGRILKL